MKKIKRALISVSDKSDIIEFARFLEKNLGVEILSTGGTEKLLSEAGIKVKSVSEHTGFPEMMQGRIKTLHPKIFAGLLAIRDNHEHQAALKNHGIDPIDLVIVNLYPFEKTIAQTDCSFEEAIENIDIGGPSMLRAAAKNYQDVAVIVDTNDYAKIRYELEKNDGTLSIKTRLDLMKKTFAHTAKYDGAISNYLSSLNDEGEREKYPKILNLQYEKVLPLRYGENPHQDAAYYSEGWHDEPCVGNARLLQGKQLSFNNLLDLNAALEIVKEFDEAACVILKHNNPCGAAIDNDDLLKAFEAAKACDPTSAFGGIIGFNRQVDEALAQAICETFFECIIAPDYTYEAKQIFATKQNLRILKTLPVRRHEIKGFDAKKIVGGILIQDRDTAMTLAEDSKLVTKIKASEAQMRDLNFAWKICKHVKSNAIVYAKNGQTLGIGAGQMSRVDAAQLGVDKANFSLEGSVMASDAFFPFRDGIDSAAKNGVKAVIQPGGSIRDEEVIAAADEHGIAMLFTGERHFKH
jgi:phosphoribosylaminoimidazolecarboxamide formyltransferase/IMP cyclohydrolase